MCILKLRLKESKNKTISCAMKSYRLSELSKAEVDSLKVHRRIDFSSIFRMVEKFLDLEINTQHCKNDSP
ncbi:hypothetical protein MKW92_050073, partial [Papaver armeniacum]